MADPQYPFEEPIDTLAPADRQSHWISPGARRGIRRLSILLGVLIVLQGANAFNAWDARRQAIDARHDLQVEVQSRIDANARNAFVQCNALNDVAVAAKATVAGTGAALTQSDVELVTDPQIRALLQMIVNRSTANQEMLRELGDKIPIVDCDAQARRAR